MPRFAAVSDPVLLHAPLLGDLSCASRGALRDSLRLDRALAQRRRCSRTLRAATAAIEAPIAKARSFIRTVGTPIAAAATSSSRIDAHARPTRELLTRRTKKMTTTINARVSQ